MCICKKLNFYHCILLLFILLYVSFYLPLTAQFYLFIYSQFFKLEDVAMGIWIEQFRNGGKEVHYENDERFYNAGCDSNYVLAHYQNPRMVLCLWEKLLKEHKPECCE